MKKLSITLLLLITVTASFSQKCRTLSIGEYDADTDMTYQKLIGGIIYNDNAKSAMTGLQDIIGLYTAKSEEGDVFLYLQHTRYIDNDNSTSRDDLSINKDNDIIIVGDFGKINLKAFKDQSPSSEVKTMTRSTKNKICQIYALDEETLEKLCSGLITNVIINYATAPKLIKKIKEKVAKKHLKYWSCSPKEL